MKAYLRQTLSSANTRSTTTVKGTTRSSVVLSTVIANKNTLEMHNAVELCCRTMQSNSLVDAQPHANINTRSSSSYALKPNLNTNMRSSSANALKPNCDMRSDSRGALKPNSRDSSIVLSSIRACDETDKTNVKEGIDSIL